MKLQNLLQKKLKSICTSIRIIHNWRGGYLYKYKNNYNYLYKYKNKYNWIGVIILNGTIIWISPTIQSTIYDVQNEKDYFGLCNEFDYNHDFGIVFWKIDDALLVFVIIDNIVLLYLVDYYNELVL